MRVKKRANTKIIEVAMKSNQIGTCYQEVFLYQKKVQQFFIFCFLMLVNESIYAQKIEGNSQFGALSKARKQQIMEVESSSLMGSSGMPIKNMALFSINKTGKMQQIPFQINEKNEEGFLYFKEANVPFKGLA